MFSGIQNVLIKLFFSFGVVWGGGLSHKSFEFRDPI